MPTRIALAVALLGLALVGGAAAPPARTDPPGRPPAKDGKSNNVEYFCPMHPSIVRDDPRYGKCPVCFLPFSKQPARPDKRSPEERVQEWKADLAWHRAEIVPAVRANLSKLPPEERSSAEAQGWCPILEANPLGLTGPPVKTTIKGQTVFLCCKDCDKDAKDNPDQTLARADKLRALVKKQHEVKGKVVRITMTIEHEDIPGVLKHGRMEFSAEGVQGLESLKAGGLVQGRLKLKDGDYKITELSATQPAAPPPAKEGKPGAAAKPVTVVVGAAPAADTAALAKSKVAAAKAAFEVTFKDFREGKADAEKVYLWSRRWMEAQRDASDKNAEWVTAVEAHPGCRTHGGRWQDQRRGDRVALTLRVGSCSPPPAIFAREGRLP